jgi:hypothetical protein
MRLVCSIASPPTCLKLYFSPRANAAGALERRFERRQSIIYLLAALCAFANFKAAMLQAVTTIAGAVRTIELTKRFPAFIA